LTAAASKDELRSYVREQRATYHATQRNIAVVLPYGLVMLALPAIALVPAVKAALGVSALEFATIVLPIPVVMLLNVAIYRRLGSASRIYKATDWFETAVVQAVVALLVYRSRRGDSFFWLLYLTHIINSTSFPELGALNLSTLLAGPLVLAAAFALQGNTAAATFALAAGLLGAMLLSFGTGLQRRIANLSIESARLSRENAALRLSADRARIARDLHDGLTADLTAMAWRADDLRRGESAAPLNDALLLLGERARSAIDETRSVVWALRADDRSWEELTGHIGARCAELCEGKLELLFEPSSHGPNIPGDVALDITRAVQEAVRNALRHAHAKRVHVELSAEGDERVRLAIADDGVGLPADQPCQEGGLANLRTRAEARGGSLALVATNPGTRITLDLQLRRAPS